MATGWRASTRTRRSLVHNGTEPAKNIATLDFYYKQFGYLLGYIAAKMTESGKTGFIGACSSPTRKVPYQAFVILPDAVSILALVGLVGKPRPSGAVGLPYRRESK